MNPHYPWILTGPVACTPAPPTRESRVVERICHGWSVCAECRQAWPCATELAIASVNELHQEGRTDGS